MSITIAAVAFPEFPLCNLDAEGGSAPGRIAMGCDMTLHDYKINSHISGSFFCARHSNLSLTLGHLRPQ
jgi:hypothetical protein